jgi:hypothetical protein
MRKAFVFTICLGALLLGSLACGRSVRSPQAEDGGLEGDQPQYAPQPTVTAFPTPPPLKFMPQAPPKDGDLAAIVHYANSMQPLFVDAGAILERDGVSMQKIINEVRAIQPPQDASVVHDLVLKSGDAWIEALDNVEEFCKTGKQLYKIPAALKFWEAGATLQDAGNRFWIFLDIDSRNRSGRLGPALKVGISSCWRMA